MNGANSIACSVETNGVITKAIPSITVSNPQKKPANKPYAIDHSPKRFIILLFHRYRNIFLLLQNKQIQWFLHLSLSERYQ